MLGVSPGEASGVATTVKPRFLNPRSPSLLRASFLVLSSLGIALLLSGFPNSRPTLTLILPAAVAIVGTLDTMRCMQRRWNLYHGGVILCIYMDLMALALIFFLLLYPYMLWMSSTR